MSKLLMTLVLTAFSFLFAPSVMAANGIDFVPAGGIGDPTTRIDCSETPDSPICEDLAQTGNPLFGPTGILTKVAGIFGLVTGVISSFIIILAGLRYILSGGDSAKTAAAKNTILYAAVGLAVGASAGIIARFILSRLS